MVVSTKFNSFFFNLKGSIDPLERTSFPYETLKSNLLKDITNFSLGFCIEKVKFHTTVMKVSFQLGVIGEVDTKIAKGLADAEFTYMLGRSILLPFLIDNAAKIKKIKIT